MKNNVSTSVRKFIFYVQVDGVVNTAFKEPTLLLSLALPFHTLKMF